MRESHGERGAVAAVELFALVLGNRVGDPRVDDERAALDRGDQRQVGQPARAAADGGLLLGRRYRAVAGQRQVGNRHRHARYGGLQHELALFLVEV